MIDKISGPKGASSSDGAQPPKKASAALNESKASVESILEGEAPQIAGRDLTRKELMALAPKSSSHKFKASNTPAGTTIPHAVFAASATEMAKNQARFRA